MLVHVPAVLTADELQEARLALVHAPWGDGKATAGVQSAPAKNNLQLPEEHTLTGLLQALVLGALKRNPQFFTAALPKHIFPPLFNCYTGSTNAFGNHVDNAVRIHRASGQRIRTDVSCTLFLADPADYDGGELVIEDTFGTQRVKLPAGDLVLYPGSSIHRVEPVTRGARMASVFWLESLVRSDAQRRLLYELDTTLLKLRARDGESDEAVRLTGTYHNLLRMWGDS